METKRTSPSPAGGEMPEPLMDGHGAGLLPLESDEGLGAEEAVRRVRALRPGSVKTPAQLAAIRTRAGL